MKKERLTVEDRILIERLLKLDYKLKDIAKAIDVYPSTISREIKYRRISEGKNEHCPLTDKYPFICYGCHKKYNCNKNKYYYGYKSAQGNYESKLRCSRIGIDMSIDEVEYWNDYFRDKLKDKNQPILHIFKNVEDTFPKSIQSFYKYVHKGYFPSIHDEMLARSFNYKPRNKTEKVKTISIDNVVKQGRRMSDFEQYINEHPDCNIVEMDTVIGKFEDEKCIMTLYFRKSKLMLMFLIKKYKPTEVVKVFNDLKEVLGEELFKKMFEVILTDNGWEFSKPQDIEFNYETGEKIVNVFYTEPYSSWQKGGIERNHEFIRYIIPKGITFDNLSKKNVTNMMNNINNIQRKSLNYQTPYLIFKKEYGEDISKKLHLIQIAKNEVNLSYKLLSK